MVADKVTERYSVIDGKESVLYTVFEIGQYKAREGERYAGTDNLAGGRKTNRHKP